MDSVIISLGKEMLLFVVTCPTLKMLDCLRKLLLQCLRLSIPIPLRGVAAEAAVSAGKDTPYSQVSEKAILFFCFLTVWKASRAAQKKEAKAMQWHETMATQGQKGTVRTSARGGGRRRKSQMRRNTKRQRRRRSKS